MLCSVESVDIHHLNVILMMGIVIFGGIVGAKIFQKLKIPQVIGYLVIGLIIGETGFKIVSKEAIEMLNPLNFFALGIIGFMIGGELKLGLFKKYGKQFSVILLGEGLAAFAIVGTAATLIAYAFLHDLRMSLAIGIVLGAISSATDPASTLQVMWEYKTRGILTTATTAVVALDDALALTLYGIGTSVAGVLTGNEGEGIGSALGGAFVELGGALVLGVLGGFILNWILHRTKEHESMLVFALGGVLLVIGLSIALELDVILASMALGLTIVNIAPRRSEETFMLVKRIAPPIYILFFVFVGAGIQLSSLSALAWSLVIAYVVGRSLGKMGGSYFGAIAARSGRTIRKYLGLCLFAQGGVAVGLSILASQRFADRPELAEMIIIIVATTTLVVQFLGPACVKFAVKGAGEIGMNVTEDDLVKSFTVLDVMDPRPSTIRQESPLRQIISTFCDSDSIYYPVIDNDRKLLGIITIDGIRETFTHQETAAWLLACDVMLPVMDLTSPGTPLEDAMGRMREYNLDHMCVANESGELCGLINLKTVERNLSAEVLRRREMADDPGEVAV